MITVVTAKGKVIMHACRHGEVYVWGRDVHHIGEVPSLGKGGALWWGKRYAGTRNWQLLLEGEQLLPCESSGAQREEMAVKS